MTNWRLERFDTLASTSDFCIGRARAGEPAGFAVMAYRQSAGRGSRGRQWIAPPGNLNLSALIRPALPPAQAGLFALLAGLATAEALDGLLPAATTLLKWPNDVMLNGAKLAGILIDTAPAADRLDWLVFGIGANLRHAPEIPGRATTTLAEHGGDASAEDAAQAVLARLAYWLDRLDAGGAALRAAWLQRAPPLGTEIEVRLAATTRRGSFAGLSPNGELLLRQGDIVVTANTGEILSGVPCCS